MSSNFELALQLLFVGMLTVFAILFLVVFIGSTIIKFVNRYVPETVASAPVAKQTTSIETIDPKKMSAIVSAVSSVTGGKGKVVKVEKI